MKEKHRNRVRNVRNVHYTATGGDGMSVDTKTDEALALSSVLVLRLLEVLNAKPDAWHAGPAVVAHALGEVLGSVLTAALRLDASRLPWALALLDQVRAHVVAADAPAEVRH
jgi:hypothetical protein